jgi:hypothetical protein
MRMLLCSISGEHPGGGRGSTGMDAKFFPLFMAAATRADRAATIVSAAARAQPLAATLVAFAVGAASGSFLKKRTKKLHPVCRRPLR